MRPIISSANSRPTVRIIDFSNRLGFALSAQWRRNPEPAPIGASLILKWNSKIYYAFKFRKLKAFE